MKDAFFDTFYFNIKGYDRKFIAFVDDCGKLKDLPVSALYEDGEIALVGNIFICCFTRDGELTTLTKLDIAALNFNIKGELMLTDEDIVKFFFDPDYKIPVKPVLINIEKRW